MEGIFVCLGVGRGGGGYNVSIKFPAYLSTVEYESILIEIASKRLR